MPLPGERDDLHGPTVPLEPAEDRVGDAAPVLGDGRPGRSLALVPDVGCHRVGTDLHAQRHPRRAGVPAAFVGPPRRHPCQRPGAPSSTGSRPRRRSRPGIRCASSIRAASAATDELGGSPPSRALAAGTARSEARAPAPGRAPPSRADLRALDHRERLEHRVVKVRRHVLPFLGAEVFAALVRELPRDRQLIHGPIARRRQAGERHGRRGDNRLHRTTRDVRRQECGRPPATSTAPNTGRPRPGEMKADRDGPSLFDDDARRGDASFHARPRRSARDQMMAEPNAAIAARPDEVVAEPQTQRPEHEERTRQREDRGDRPLAASGPAEGWRGGLLADREQHQIRWRCRCPRPVTAPRSRDGSGPSQPRGARPGRARDAGDV